MRGGGRRGVLPVQSVGIPVRPQAHEGDEGEVAEEEEPTEEG